MDQAINIDWTPSRYVIRNSYGFMLFLMRGRRVLATRCVAVWAVGSITTGLGKYAHGVNEGRERERRRAARDHF